MIQREPSHRHSGSLEDAAELAVHALLPIVPITGSWEAGYRVSDRIDPTLMATPEEWANAAHAVAELHSWIKEARRGS